METALQIWIFTAFSEVSENLLMRNSVYISIACTAGLSSYWAKKMNWVDTVIALAGGGLMLIPTFYAPGLSVWPGSFTFSSGRIFSTSICAGNRPPRSVPTKGIVRFAERSGIRAMPFLCVGRPGRDYAEEHE